MTCEHNYKTESYKEDKARLYKHVGDRCYNPQWLVVYIHIIYRLCIIRHQLHEKYLPATDSALWEEWDEVQRDIISPYIVGSRLVSSRWVSRFQEYLFTLSEVKDIIISLTSQVNMTCWCCSSCFFQYIYPNVSNPNN